MDLYAWDVVRRRPLSLEGYLERGYVRVPGPGDEHADVAIGRDILIGWVIHSRSSKVVHVGWCPIPPGKGVRVQWLVEYVMAFLQRREAAGGSSGPGATPPPGSAGAKRTALWEYMCLDAYEDGSQRTRSSVTVFSDGGEWKAMLKDKDAQMVLWVSAKTLDGVLDALDASLRASDAPWRADRQQGQTGSQGRPRR